ncbi:MAG: hypothetical protein FD127_4406, partial [Acidimicrobiaceae bacterium]
QTPNIVREVRAWLDFARYTHAFMECHAIASFENDVMGRFLTTNGVTTSEPVVDAPVINRIPDSPFAQFDGTLTADTGSVSSVEPAAGSAFHPYTRIMIEDSMNDVMWASARLGGDANNGQITYLGGHNYSVALPVTANPQTNGVRLFLDSLFESDCANSTGAPNVTVVKSAPAFVTGPDITFTLTYTNTGAGTADNTVLTDAIPAGTTFVSATGGGVFAAGTVTWTLGNLAPGATGMVTFTVSALLEGTYSNTATARYFASLTPRTTNSNTTMTVVDRTPPDTRFDVVEPDPTADPTGDFVIGSPDAGVTFECRVDGAAFMPCPAMFTTASLGNGTHTIE